MKTNPIDEAKDVFHTLERWTAFYEIEKQVSAIMDRWLTIGSKALKQQFEANPSPSWKCADWGPPRDTRWYLAGEGEQGMQGIGIGIGWREFEFHLFHGGCDTGVTAHALRLLESPDFEPLRSLMGSAEYRSEHRKEGSILSVRDFNPFDEVSDSGLRPRIIAWHAAHETAGFVERVSTRIRQITENPEIGRLISELNRQTATITLPGPVAS